MLVPHVLQEPVVVLVEDDVQTRDGYAELLSRAGFRVISSDNAECALAQCIELVPDVVVTDIALPGRDGFGLAADLRCQVSTRGIPVVAMTAHWSPDVHQRAVEVGMTAILSKPCQPEHLIAELQRVLEQTRLPRLARSAAVAIDYARTRIAQAKSHP